MVHSSNTCCKYHVRFTVTVHSNTCFGGSSSIIFRGHPTHVPASIACGDDPTGCRVARALWRWMTQLGVALHVHCGDDPTGCRIVCALFYLGIRLQLSLLVVSAVHTRACSSWSHWGGGVEGGGRFKCRAKKLFRLLSKYVLLQQTAAHSWKWVIKKKRLFVCFFIYVFLK